MIHWTVLQEALEEGHALIEPHIHRTPVMTSRQLDKMVGGALFLKCENFQKGGSYKIRGALHAMMHLSEDARRAGVVTHSSGNFAQAVTLAGQLLGIPVHIIMPESAPRVKRVAVEAYGGEVIVCESTLEAREAAAREVIDRTGAHLLHPSNDLDVIIGQGTATLELLGQAPDLDAVICPVGGGGVVAGACIAARGTALVYGSEPFAVDDAWRSLQSGRIESNQTTNTIADGLRTQLGEVNFPIIRHGVKEIIRVTEEEIVAAMRLLWERMKIVVEPSSAVALAGVLARKEAFQGLRTGIVLTGGNVDLGALPF